jgi:hypothetical protein
MGKYDPDDDYGAGPDDPIDDIDPERAAERTRATTFLMRVVVLLVVMSGAAWFGWNYYVAHMARTARREYDIKLADTKREFTARAGNINHIEEADEYLAARRGLLGWYFGALRDLETAFAKHPAVYDPDSELVALRATSKDLQAMPGGSEAEVLHGDKFERAFALVKESYETLSERPYEVVVGQGRQGTRLDFARLTRQKIDGEERLKVDFFLWGAFKGLGFGPIEIEILNENQNKFGSLTGGGAPELLVRTPENQVRQYPPDVWFGSYAFDLLPTLAHSVNIRLTYNSQLTTGQSSTWTYEFLNLPVDPTWKVLDDAAWNAAAGDQYLPEEERPKTVQERMEAAVKEADRRAAEEARQKPR